MHSYLCTPNKKGAQLSWFRASALQAEGRRFDPVSSHGASRYAGFFIECLLYIFYIPNLKNRYYVGHTGDAINERLRRHNSNHKGFTGKTKDWTIVYIELYNTKEEAYKREREIKAWKSRMKIEDLVKGKL